MQARRGVAEKGPLTQQGGSNALRMKEEGPVTALEEFELVMTGTFDDVEGDEIPLELHARHSIAAATARSKAPTSHEDSYMHASGKAHSGMPRPCKNL